MRTIAGSIGLLAVAGAAFAGVTAWNMAMTLPPLDETNLCLLDAPFEEHVIVLIDVSDELTQLHVAMLSAAIDEERETAATHAKLSVLAVSADAPWAPEEIVSLCNPGSPIGATWFGGNPPRIRQKWEQDFGLPIEAAVKRALSRSAMARSPILQSITALTWRPDFDSRVPHRRLRIVSDLLQHEPGGYSQYRNGDLWLDFAERPLSAQTEAHLDGVDVVIDYLPRPESALYQSTAHRAFWRRWLMARGAAGLHFQAMAQVKPRFADTAKEDDDAR